MPKISYYLDTKTNPTDTTSLEDQMKATVSKNGMTVDARTGEIMSEQQDTFEQGALDLSELTRNLQLTDTFEFVAMTVLGETTIPVRFTHWESQQANTTEGLSGFVAGNPAEWVKPIKDYYEVLDAYSALASIERKAMIDPMGLILNVPLETINAMYRGESLGYVAHGYAGDYSNMPTFEPGKGEKWNTAWAEIVKHGVLETDFVAVKGHSQDTGRHYASVEAWKKAQTIYNECDTIMSLFNDGGVIVWTNTGLERVTRYFYLLWNLAAVDADRAAQVAKSHYKTSVQRQQLRRDTQKAWSRNQRAEQEGKTVQPVTVIGGITLKDGCQYQICTPGGIVLGQPIKFVLGDANAQARFTAIKTRVENRTWSLKEIGF
jgi:hypothetical protein